MTSHTKSVRLNLGCGFNKHDGYINIDSAPECEPDMTFDLERFPWPFADSSVDEIRMEHVLEHVGKTTAEYVNIWKELWRIGKPGCKIDIAVPHWNHENFHHDPTHVRTVTPVGIAMFDQMRNVRDMEGGGRETKLGLFSGIDIDVQAQDIQFGYTPKIAEAYNSGKLSNAELDHLREHQNNIVNEIRVSARVVKPARGSLLLHARRNKPHRPKPHVLFITEQEPGYIFPYNFQGSLEASGLATHTTTHPDSFKKEERALAEAEFLRVTTAEQPDLIVMSSSSLMGPHAIPLTTVSSLSKKLEIPVACVFPDSDEHLFSAIDTIRAAGITIILWDGARAYQKHAGGEVRILPLWAPTDTRLFRDSGLERDTGVCFVGTVEGAHGERKEMLEALRAAGISVTALGSNKEADRRIPASEYARTLGRSKISLNFSKNAHGTTQLKARVFETLLCGALLLEQENPESRAAFVAGTEYVEFSSAKDLVEKIKYYLSHEDERAKIAAAGKQAVIAYGPREYWRRVFVAMGVISKA